MPLRHQPYAVRWSPLTVLVAQLPGAGVVLVVIQSVALCPDARQTATQLLSDTGSESVDAGSLGP
jgi:hypothetical protein